VRDSPVEIPNRAFFKASEVCQIAQLQPYVLRSWEQEFPKLGVTRPDGARVYRRADVEQILRIKHLVFAEGLTLAGARRRLGGEQASAAEELPFDGVFDPAARDRLTEVKRGLQSLLQMLSGDVKVTAQAAAEAPTPEARLTLADVGRRGTRRAAAKTSAKAPKKRSARA